LLLVLLYFSKAITLGEETRAGSLAVRTGSWTIFLTSCLHS
jgi:hypothetical protein